MITRNPQIPDGWKLVPERMTDKEKHSKGEIDWFRGTWGDRIKMPSVEVEDDADKY